MNKVSSAGNIHNGCGVGFHGMKWDRNRKNGHIGAEGRGEGHAMLDSFLRKLRTIGWDENMFVHVMLQLALTHYRTVPLPLTKALAEQI